MPKPKGNAVAKLIDWCAANDYPLSRLSNSGAMPLSYMGLIYYQRDTTSGGQPHGPTNAAAKSVLAMLQKIDMPKAKDKRRNVITKALAAYASKK